MRLNAKTSILIFLGAAFASFLLSVSLWFGVVGEADKSAGLFVGLWVPSIHSLGTLLLAPVVGVEQRHNRVEVGS